MVPPRELLRVQGEAQPIQGFCFNCTGAGVGVARVIDDSVDVIDGPGVGGADDADPDPDLVHYGACEQCSDTDYGYIDLTNTLFYCSKCWAEFEDEDEDEDDADADVDADADAADAVAADAVA